MLRPDFRQIRHSTELYHYGMPRRSGRYPWGSGERPYQDYPEFRKQKRGSNKFTLARLNIANTQKEFYSVGKSNREAFEKKYPKVSKVTKPLIWADKKLDEIAIKHYSKVAEEQLQKLKDSKVDLATRRSLKYYEDGSWQRLWTGNKYYIKNRGDQK